MTAKGAFNAGHYRAIADIVRSIPQDDVRQVVANHFAQEFARRSGSFDAQTWNGATGGRLTGPTRLPAGRGGVT